MPLPTSNQEWPPKDAADANALVRKWHAWWSGDLAELAYAYRESVGFDSGGTISAVERTGGLELKPRFFHGTPAARGQLRSVKLHVPLAADIASTSADLLFGEPITLTVPTDATNDSRAKRTTDQAAGRTSGTQKLLDQFMDDLGYASVLLEAAEQAAALSGVYLRLTWDPTISDHVLMDAIPPDSGVPEFRSGRLTAVTFWRKLRPIGDDGNTWRHLERHEKGRVLHGVYEARDEDKLGVPRQLQDHPDTEGFAALVDANGGMDTGADGLSAEYFPNMRPNRRVRGSQLGRSDYDGIETVLDSLDEAWTSWMRDLRLGKSRLIIPDIYLESMGRGKGTLHDAEQEIYESVNHLPGGSDGLLMQQVQFNIRVAEHEQTTSALMNEAIRGAGYSVQTFGESGDTAMTATEVAAKQGRSFTTRARKQNYWRSPLARLMFAAQQMQVKHFGTDDVTPVVPDIEWPDGIANDPMQGAQTLNLLAAAGAVSTRTKVETLHPDWDDKRIADEVKDIHAEGAPPSGLMDPPGTIPGDDPNTGQAAGADAPASDQPATGQAPPAGDTKQPAVDAKAARKASRLPKAATRTGQGRPASSRAPRRGNATT